VGAEAEARAEVLGRIRAANRGGGLASAAAIGWAGIERGYRDGPKLEREAMLELLEDRLHDYEAHTMRSTREELRRAIEGRLRERGIVRLLVPQGVPEWVMPGGVSVTRDEGLSAAEIDDFDGVLTGATLAIAETGTIVLQHGAEQGRRATTLVPDFHLCVVAIGDVVESVPEAMERLGATSRLATTFISGPSATADIEMTRIKGVHGPRFLDVILVG